MAALCLVKWLFSPWYKACLCVCLISEICCWNQEQDFIWLLFVMGYVTKYMWLFCFHCIHCWIDHHFEKKYWSRRCPHRLNLISYLFMWLMPCYLSFLADWVTNVLVLAFSFLLKKYPVLSPAWTGWCVWQPRPTKEWAYVLIYFSSSSVTLNLRFLQCSWTAKSWFYKWKTFVVNKAFKLHEVVSPIFCGLWK